MMHRPFSTSRSVARQQLAALQADVAERSENSPVHIRPLRTVLAAMARVLTVASGAEVVASTVAGVAPGVEAGLGIEAELVQVAVVEEGLAVA
jgi:hypothetical protein